MLDQLKALLHDALTAIKCGPPLKQQQITLSNFQKPGNARFNAQGIHRHKISKIDLKCTNLADAFNQNSHSGVQIAEENADHDQQNGKSRVESNYMSTPKRINYSRDGSNERLKRAQPCRFSPREVQTMKSGAK